MTALRAPGGCPWDRKQTHASLRPYLLEETYEALDALDRGDLDALAGELGDVLFQVVFHAEVARGEGRFDVTDVIDRVSAKLIRRHPHVFTASGRPLPKRARWLRTSGAVVEQWERIKARERQASGEREHVLSGLPRSMPALLRAHKIGARVSAVGFDWPDATGVLDKIDEDVRELRASRSEGHTRTEEELGDVLFSVANLARRLNIEPEAALARANDRFTRRFDAVEARLAADGRSVHDASPAELESAWTAVKAAHAKRRQARSARSSRATSPRARRSRR